MRGPLRIGADLEIPQDELSFSTSRSSGPGGQNVNKVETRVTVALDLAASHSFTDEQKARLREELRGRISRDDVLQVSCETQRTQAGNRREVVERLRELIAEALAETPERKPTAVPKASKRRRLEAKRRRAEIKRGRRTPHE